MVTGDASGLNARTKEVYFELGQGHLFTPSGVHLEVLAPVLKLMSWERPLLILLALSAGSLPGLLALSRVAWIKAIPEAKLHLWAFSFILLTEGMLRSWTSSPISWICSWLFLGFSRFAPKRTVILWFLLGQVVLNWVFLRPLSPLIVVANLVVGIPLALTFPILLGASLLPRFGLHGFILGGLGHLHELVLWLDDLHRYLPPTHPHAGHVLAGVALLILPSHRKTLGAALSILALSAPTGGLSIPKPEMSRWEVVPTGHLVATQNTSKGVTSTWSDGTRCKHELENGVWRENCRARGARQKRNRTRKLSSARSASRKSSLRG